MAITHGYTIDPECLSRTRLEKERQAKAKQIEGRVERILLKGTLDLVLAKGQAPSEGKWNNTDLKVMIKWYKRDVDKAIPTHTQGCYDSALPRNAHMRGGRHIHLPS
jgi:hypothetical protein